MSDSQSDPKVVPPAEGTEHGYIGTVPDPRPNEEYTVAAQTDTGQTAKTTDTPKSTSRTSSK